MTDVFVSYSQKDRMRVAPIVEALETMNWSVWWDARGRVGADLDEMVDDELAHAKCVLVVWSNNSIASDWVKSEADEGRKRKILVPVTIDDAQPPRRFRQLNTVSLKEWTGDFEDEALKRVIEGVKFHAWSGVEDPNTLRTRGYEIALERMDKRADRGAGKYFSILNSKDPITALKTDFGWTMGSDDYGPIKYYYLYISHPDVADGKILNITRVYELETLKNAYPDSWQSHIDYLKPVLVLDYSYFQLLEDEAAAVGGMLYGSGVEPLEFYAPLAEWSTRLSTLLG